MNTLVIFKISYPDVRKKLFCRLKDRGIYLGQGVFECDLCAAEQERLLAHLREMPLATSDYVVVHTLCHACRRKRAAFGKHAYDDLESEELVII